MTEYRRAFISGGTYFFTVNLADRRGTLLVDHIDALRSAFRYTRERHPFASDAVVVLPDHLHAIWTLPEGDTAFPLRWRLIKAAFSRTLPSCETISKSRARRSERGIWQHRYWEHAIRDEGDLNRHLDYIHFNPVKHGYTESPKDWPYSSFRRAVELGLYPVDWAADAADTQTDFGERRAHPTSAQGLQTGRRTAPYSAGAPTAPVCSVRRGAATPKIVTIAASAQKPAMA
ncbi:MAG TPA: transposase [Stellaceae bacterium]|jgi:putative transposase|nr:transposase [Stellaceae bacterium]